MTHMSMYPGNREIIEIEEELSSGEHYRSNSFMKPEMRRDEKDRRSLASNSGTVSSLEEDLNQLFEIFNRRASSHGSSHQNQAGTSKRNTSKKPAKGGGSPSPGHGISESMNLKKALRGLCLSQASEMAAMKRSMKSPRSSEAGRIMTMYRNVVVEDTISDHSVEDSRGGMLEISLVPEQSTFDSFQSVPEKLPATDLWPSNRSSLGEKVLSPTITQNDRIFEASDCGTQMKKQEKPAGGMISSFSHANDNIPNIRQGILTQENGNQSPGNKMRQKQNLILPLPSSSPTVRRNMREAVKTTTRENEKSSASVEHASQANLVKSFQTGMRASPTSLFHSTYARSSFELANKMPALKDSPVSSVEAGNYMSQVDMLHQEEHAHPPSSLDFCDITWEDSNSHMIENGKYSPSAACSSQLSSTESSYNEKNEGSPRASCGKTYLDNSRNLPEQKERVCVSPVVQNQKKINIASKDEHAPTRSPRRSDHGEVFDHGKNSPAPPKVVGKEASGISVNVEIKELGKVVQREILKTIPSSGSPKGKKVSRSARNAQHFVKPLIKTKNFVKRRSKKKMASDSSSKNVRSEFNNDLYSSPNPIVCPNCQCVVTDAWKEANKGSSVSHQDSPISPQESPVSHHESPAFYQDSPISPFASLSGEVSSGNVISDLSTPGPSCNGLNKSKTILVESSSNSKTRDKAEFTQSSKSSPGECSTSTSVSEESNLSRPSVCDRPHMSKDVRWEAIRHVRFQHGTLGLRNFSLLKKLGCGDIGTVYLAELIGTNCQFAIKVMDNEFLARRKKISRAQTEKEILRMLDHPFLPTLYCQFTSDNLSCLVMEYCPGGDLHVLRQRQPGKCFTEQAARFYVAEVLLALEYLHMLGVVYRDLKPENILVREDGHIMLSDFDLSLRCAVSPTLLVSSSMSEGSRKVSHSRPCTDSRCAQPLCIEPSCQVTCFTPRLKAGSSKLRKMKSDVAAEMRPLLQLVAEPTTARSNSFVGTHEYLAPEIIKGEGHGSAVDWWTFGIFLYELLYGRTPFKGAGNEDTLANVVLQSLKFPDSPLVSLQARDLIAVLLVKEPENRLGTERGAAEIKQHPFFDGLNWALIRCAVPPELPEPHSYGMPKEVFSENSNNYMEYSSGSGSVEHLEFEVF